MIKSSQEIIEAARKLSTITGRRIVVAGAQDADVIGAVRSAMDDGICDGLLVGDSYLIRKLAADNNISLDGLEVINQADPDQAVLYAVQAAAAGDADVVMKGFVSTSALLKGVLDKRFNLRVSSTLSHVAVLDIPGYHKLLMLTDGGMVVKPNIKQRLDILENALVVARALGIYDSKIALSAASNDISENMPQSKESARIRQMAESKNIEDCTIAGPMTFDMATSKETAERAGIEDPVAGDADIYVVGSIEECNITAKTMIVFARAVFAGVIVGASIPVSVVSRTDPVFGKKVSIALACLVADYYRRQGREK